MKLQHPNRLETPHQLTDPDHSPPSNRSRILAVTSALIIGLSALLLRPVAAQSPQAPLPNDTTSKSVKASESTTSLDTSEDRDIEIEMKMIEVSNETYEKHREVFEKAIASSNTESFQKFLQTLNDLPGVHILSTPSIKPRTGQGASIQLGNFFRYPSEFDASGQPTNYDLKELGVFIELQPKLNGKTLTINGTLRVRELLGFIEAKPRTPTFQTIEALIFRELQPNEVAIMSVPWEKKDLKQIFETDSSPNTAECTPTGKRMLLTMRAELHPPRTRLSKIESEKYLSDLLTKTRLTEQDFRGVPAFEAISSIWNHIWQANEDQISIYWDTTVPEAVPKLTFNTKGMTAREALDEIEKQTGLICTIHGSQLSFASAEQEARGEK
jgi:hypothetical protein